MTLCLCSVLSLFLLSLSLSRSLARPGKRTSGEESYELKCVDKVNLYSDGCKRKQVHFRSLCRSSRSRLNRVPNWVPIVSTESVTDNIGHFFPMSTSVLSTLIYSQISS